VSYEADHNLSKALLHVMSASQMMEENITPLISAAGGTQNGLSLPLATGPGGDFGTASTHERRWLKL